MLKMGSSVHQLHSLLRDCGSINDFKQPHGYFVERIPVSPKDVLSVPKRYGSTKGKEREKDVINHYHQLRTERDDV
jgi:hypothetical protein